METLAGIFIGVATLAVVSAVAGFWIYVVRDLKEERQKRGGDGS